MNDTQQARIGDNVKGVDLSLALDTDVLLQKLEAAYPEMLDKTAKLLEARKRFDALTADGIKDEDVQRRAGDLLKMLSDQIKLVNSVREAVKKPLTAANALIQSFFARRQTDPLSNAVEGVGIKIKRFADAKDAAKQAELNSEAERLRTRAIELAGKGETDAAMDLEQQAEAIDAQGASRESMHEAARTTSDIGTDIGLRASGWKVRVTNINAVPVDYLVLNEPRALAVLKGHAHLAMLRKLTPQQQPIAGLEFYRETTASVR